MSINTNEAMDIRVYIVTPRGTLPTDNFCNHIGEKIDGVVRPALPKNTKINVHIMTGIDCNRPKVMLRELTEHPDAYVIVSEYKHDKQSFYTIPTAGRTTVMKLLECPTYANSWKIFNKYASHGMLEYVD